MGRNGVGGKDEDVRSIEVRGTSVWSLDCRRVSSCCLSWLLLLVTYYLLELAVGLETKSLF